jgi:hypothetical protein
VGDQVVVGHRRWSLDRYFQHSGDTIFDPEIAFDHETWTPVEITQSPVGVCRSKFVTLDGETCVDTRFHPEVSLLARVWVRNLGHQGWETATLVKKTECRI